MRICPKCGYKDDAIWRPAKMHNPSGDIDIARDEDVKIWLPKVWEQLSEKRGKEAIVDGVFAYYIGKRGVWVRRAAADVYQQCGLIAFNPPYETSGHNKLAIQIFAKPQKIEKKGISLNPNCPKCGTKMQRLIKASFEHPYQTFRCPKCKELLNKPAKKVNVE